MISLAKKYQPLLYDDVFEIPEKDLLMTFIGTDNEEILLKDGSVIKYVGIYQEATTIEEPNKELDLSFQKIEDDIVLRIKDDKYSKKLDNDLLNSDIREVVINKQGDSILFEKDSDFVSTKSIMTKKEKEAYLKDIGINNTIISTVLKEKNKKGLINDLLTKIGFKTEKKKINIRPK